MKHFLFLALLLSPLPCRAAEAAAPGSRIQIVAASLRLLGPDMAQTGNPSLLALSRLDLAAPSSLPKLATMARALPQTDRELLSHMLAANPPAIDGVARLMISIAQSAERYSNMQEQRIDAALKSGSLSPKDAARELKVADRLLDSPHMGSVANARIAANRAKLAALAAQKGAFDSR